MEIKADQFIFHASIDARHRDKFSELWKAVEPDTASAIHDLVTRACDGVLTPFVYNIVEYLGQMTGGRKDLRSYNVNKAFRETLAEFIANPPNRKVFPHKFYARMKSKVGDYRSASQFDSDMAHQRELRDLKIKRRLDGQVIKFKPRYSPRFVEKTDQMQKVLKSEEYRVLNQVMAEKVCQLSLNEIIRLQRQTYSAKMRRRLTKFCARLVKQLEITPEMIGKMFVYCNPRGLHKVRKQIIKTVMSQLRLRVCREAVSSGVLIIGEPIPTDTKCRVLQRITTTGKLMIRQNQYNQQMTHLDPLYEPFLALVRDTQNQEVYCPVY